MPAFSPDLAIAWMSQQGLGTIADLKEKIGWMSGTSSSAAMRWIGALNILGIADLDWDSGSWKVREPGVAPLPGRTNVALATGGRSYDVVAGEIPDLIVHRNTAYPATPELELPPTLWIHYSSTASLSAAASVLGARLSACEADKAADALKPLQLGKPIPPPARTRILARFDRASWKFATCRNSSRPAEGLYEYELYGRKIYAIVRDGNWHCTDRYSGIHLDMPRPALPLQWKAEIIDNRGGGYRRFSLGRLIVDSRSPLPARQAETAALCTGLPPLRANGHNSYDGVPLYIARKIAWTLNRILEESK